MTNKLGFCRGRLDLFRSKDHDFFLAKVIEDGAYYNKYSLLYVILMALGLPFPVHPHMLRHACGFYLANKGVDTCSIQHYLGHRNIRHTVRYTELAPHRFDVFWDD